MYTDLWFPNLQRWHEQGEEAGASYLVVSYDESKQLTPHFVMPYEVLEEAERRIRGGGTETIFETYDLSTDLTESQIDGFKTYVQAIAAS